MYSTALLICNLRFQLENNNKKTFPNFIHSWW